MRCPVTRPRNHRPWPCKYQRVQICVAVDVSGKLKGNAYHTAGFGRGHNRMSASNTMSIVIMARVSFILTVAHRSSAGIDSETAKQSVSVGPMYS